MLQTRQGSEMILVLRSTLHKLTLISVIIIFEVQSGSVQEINPSGAAANYALTEIPTLIKTSTRK